MEIIKKLKDNKIFKEKSIVKSTIEKAWMGSPVEVEAHLIVNTLKDNYCICEEYLEATKKTYKIRYIDITTIDGMEPQELAAVYGLAPKTERFYKRKTNK